MSAPHRRVTEHTETGICEQYNDENSQEHNFITDTRASDIGQRRLNVPVAKGFVARSGSTGHDVAGQRSG
jgi:hypothetical protein